MQTCYFEHFENAWSCPSIMIVSPCRNLWCPKYWNQLVGNFDFNLREKNLPYLSCFLWDIAKILQTCYFGYFGHAWLLAPKVTLTTCRKILCLSAGKKSTSPPMFFWRYCKVVQLLNLGTLSMPGYSHPNDTSICIKLRCLSACQK